MTRAAVMRLLWAALALTAAPVLGADDRVAVEWGAGRRTVTVRNRFVLFTVAAHASEGGDAGQPQGLVRLVGDFSGRGSFAGKPNLLASPLRTMVQFNDSMLPVPCTAASPPAVSRVDARVLVSVSFFAARSISPGVRAELQTTWTLELRPHARSLVFTAAGRGSRDGIYGAYHAIDFQPRSITAFYPSGVAQMMNQDGWMGYRAARDPLLSLYALGGGRGEQGAGCVELLRLCPGSALCADAPPPTDTEAPSSSRAGLRCCARRNCGEETGASPLHTFIVSTTLTSGLRELLIGHVAPDLPTLNAWGEFKFSPGDPRCAADYTVGGLHVA